MSALIELSESALRAALDWAYDRALSPGVPGIESVEQLAEAYGRGASSPREAAEALIRWQTGKTAAAGFVTAFGGFASLPLTLTADVAATYFLQLRMVATIATFGALNPQDHAVREDCFRCVLNHEPWAAEAVSTSVVGRFASKRWLARAGRLRVRRLGRVVPVVGGVLNGSINGVVTWHVGRRAMELFLNAP